MLSPVASYCAAGLRLLGAVACGFGRRLGFGEGPFRFLLVGWRPAGIEGVAGLVEVDEQRGMVRGDGLALSGFAVDLDEDRSFRDGLGDEQVVDAHAEVLVEVTGAVVPPGVLPGVGVLRAEDVDEAPRTELGEGAPLRLRDVRTPMAGNRVPDVRVRRGDVEVASERDRLAGVAGLDEPPGEALVPLALRMIERRVSRAPVASV